MTEIINKPKVVVKNKNTHASESAPSSEMAELMKLIKGLSSKMESGLDAVSKRLDEVEARSAAVASSAASASTSPHADLPSNVEDERMRSYLIEHLENYKQFVRSTEMISLLTGKQYRRPNFPESFSEPLVAYLLNVVNPEFRATVICQGDLEYYCRGEIKKGQIKAASSKGPVTFGPDTKWDSLFVLDARGYMDNRYKLYHIDVPSDDEFFSQISVNSKETFGEHQAAGRRPRLGCEKLLKHFEQDALIYDGPF
jgi:hypothetical protein